MNAFSPEYQSKSLHIKTIWLSLTRRKAIFKEIALGGKKAQQNNFTVISKEKQKDVSHTTVAGPCTSKERNRRNASNFFFVMVLIKLFPLYFYLGYKY